VTDNDLDCTRETHISVVALVGDRAYKIPKPVRFAFLDQSTPARRAEVCAREVELNRRMAPDVYLGAGEIAVNGETVEHCVVMRRMPENRRLSGLVASDSVQDEIRDVARLLAKFHAEAERGPTISAAGGIDAVGDLWRSNLDEFAELDLAAVDGEVRPKLDTIGRLVDRFLAGRTALFRTRQSEGHVCDGHGDLLADDIFCLDDGPRILDCLAFSDRYRHGDVLLDLAFLAMDLERCGAPHLAEELLVAYSEFSAERHPRALADHYIAYRALVRAKVSVLSGSLDAAQALVDLCARHLEQARVRVVLVGGPPGTGKSTLARQLGDTRGWPVLSTDEIRKEQAGRAWTDHPHEDLDEGLYDPAVTEATYDMLLLRAKTILSMGESVVLDASWSTTTARERAIALAEGAHADVHELCCSADPAVVDRRVAERAVTGQDVSDASATTARDLRARFEAWPAAEPIDTEPSPSLVAARVLELLDRG
jgi:aminoglycoside phosphotransferase family enzyme/predicted kinase